MVQNTISLDQMPAEEPQEKSHGGCGSCGTGRAGEASRCGNGLEKIYPTTAVRFGYMRYIGEFTHAPELKFTCGAKVVIQTRRGIEIGEQVSLTCGGCDKSVPREKMKEWVATCGEDAYAFEAGRILREATAVDLAEYAHIQGANSERRKLCQQVANRYKLPMRVVECESPFGGERIIFYFTAEERIDFREMVKDLALEFRTRIEMRQVGARDEARLLADYETCGREVCCKVFLKTLRPISMRMAKVQKATLDPSQVSGRCGRLKCCLRYEHVGYEELDRKLPKVGVRIATNHGEGVIVNRQILTQLVQIRTDLGKLLTVVAEDITEVGIKPRPLPAPGDVPPEKRPAPRAPRERSPRRPLRDAGQRPPSAAPAPEVDGNRAQPQREARPPAGEGQDRGRRRSIRRRRGRGDGPQRRPDGPQDDNAGGSAPPV